MFGDYVDYLIPPIVDVPDRGVTPNKKVDSVSPSTAPIVTTSTPTQEKTTNVTAQEDGIFLSNRAIIYIFVFLLCLYVVAVLRDIRKSLDTISNLLSKRGY